MCKYESMTIIVYKTRKNGASANLSHRFSCFLKPGDTLICKRAKIVACAFFI